VARTILRGMCVNVVVVMIQLAMCAKKIVAFMQMVM
jgi:hypothetical protein